jgi:TDG/mug DNA glycosylase family protein
LDVAKAMLDLVPQCAPSALRVQADLEALPFRREALGAAWARNSYVHLERVATPLALADLHRSMRPGGHAMIAFFLGDDEGRDIFDGNEFTGRYFSRWDLGQLLDMILGAGFELDEREVRTNDAKEDEVHLDLTRARTLPDVVGPRMRLLVCGLNPSLNAADAGVGFARPGNRFWPAAIAAELVSVDRDPWHALRHHGVGFTDLVKRATVGAAELSTDEYRFGFARLERLAAWLQPAAVAFVGLAGWRAAVDRKAVAGPQSRTVGGRPVYLMPSSSGLNARSTLDSLAQHLRAALTLA